MVENESESLNTALAAVEAGRVLIAYSRRAPEEARVKHFLGREEKLFQKCAKKRRGEGERTC